MNHVRKALDAIATRISELKDAVQHHSRTEHEAEERKRKQEPPPNQPKKVSAVISYDDETVRDAKTEAGRQYATQKSIKNAAWAAFCAASIYALIAAFQLCQIQESNQISRESLESVQRAFVSFQNFEYFRIQDPDNPDTHKWDVLADFDNNGATNAIDVVGILQIQELPTEPTDEQFRGPYTHFPILSIPPKSKRAVRIAQPIAEPLIFGIDLGPVITTRTPSQTHFNRHLFVWSWVYYRDVFAKNKPHVTEFCNQLSGINLLTENYNPKASSLVPGNVNFSYAGCADHNCEDQQCKDYNAIVALVEKASLSAN